MDSKTGKIKRDYTIEELIEKTKEMRAYNMVAITAAGSGHTGGTLSIMDITAALYLKEINHDPANPDWEERDRFLREIIKKTHFFQFGDYPISRNSKKFSVTFRYLLENELFKPLKNLCGELPYTHFIEFTGIDKDKEISMAYQEELLDLREKNSYIIQLKGIGMDGHWGFHGSETPLDMPPDMIAVPMNKQNIQQQRIDWPEFFPRVEDVPKTAYTFNINMFLLADEIIDNVPRSTKEYAVLATYGTEDIINEIPSSALKKHYNAQAYITGKTAKALIEFRTGRDSDKGYKLNNTTLNRLRDLWKDDANQAYSQQNIKIMEEVLRKLNMI